MRTYSELLRNLAILNISLSRYRFKASAYRLSKAVVDNQLDGNLMTCMKSSILVNLR